MGIRNSHTRRQSPSRSRCPTVREATHVLSAHSRLCRRRPGTVVASAHHSSARARLSCTTRSASRPKSHSRPSSRPYEARRTFPGRSPRLPWWASRKCAHKTERVPSVRVFRTRDLAPRSRLARLLLRRMQSQDLRLER